MNIFKQCFAPLLRTKTSDLLAINIIEGSNGHSRKFTKQELRKLVDNRREVEHEQSLLVPAVEDRFFKLVTAGEKYGYNTDRIMEIPTYLGSTVFETATLFSVKICQYILNRKIRVNDILANFVYPVFNMHFTDEMWEKMLKKGINPKVITGQGFLSTGFN